jgi:uncharacterized protein
MRFVTAFVCAVMLICLGVAAGHAAQRAGQSVSQIQPQEIPSKEGLGEEAAKEPPTRTGTPSDPVDRFVAAILGDTEDRWAEIFREGGEQYRPPTLLLFSGFQPSGCGFARSVTGPFYCPHDQRIYLDTSFFQDLQTEFRACSGQDCEFPQAYVIAHEVGHHVQKLLGLLARLQPILNAANDTEYNRLRVRIELQADCFAGVWANRAHAQLKFLTVDDVAAALNAAAAIGDDWLQMESQGYTVPDSFTHGTSEQRQHWFSTGLKGGKVADCNTFAASSK